MFELPSLIFSLQSLATDSNIKELRMLIDNFSMIYVEVAKERIDLAGTSHLMFAWTEADCYNEKVGQALMDICLEKHKENNLFEAGCATELVNILKSMQAL